MRAIVVLEFEIKEPEEVAGILTAIDPPKLPKFSGAARVSVGMPAARVIEYLDGPDGGPMGAPVPEVSGALKRLEQLTRDFAHYARHGSPAGGIDTFFRVLHGHLSSLLLYAGGYAPLAEVVAGLEADDRAIAEDAIKAGITAAVGTRRQGSGFGR